MVQKKVGWLNQRNKNFNSEPSCAKFFDVIKNKEFKKKIASCSWQTSTSF